MTHLDILLPFGLPPAALATDLLRGLQLPALATLLSRAARIPETLDEAPLALPHEAWLARRFGLEQELRKRGSLPLAAAAMGMLGLDVPDEGTWFVVNPVHIHIARDHLVLIHPRHLEMTQDEGRTLFDIAQALFEEDGKTLLYGNESTWFARADDWSGLQTASPDAASGHNIDIWMPHGEGERNWRKLQNEVQMHWFADAINAHREAAGRKTVNSIWLWGGTAAGLRPQSPYSHVFHPGGWMGGVAHWTSSPLRVGAAQEVLAARSEHGLLMLDALLSPALDNDWGRWQEQLCALEDQWFAPLLDALKGGGIDRLVLHAGDDSRMMGFSAGRTALRKFWVKPSLAALQS